MPIQTITLRNIASYDASGISLNNLKKLNFFVGFNGTGKSTIAKFLHNTALPAAEQSITFQDCLCSGFVPTNERILVYDESFKKENFIDSDKLKGVFSLNKANAAIDTQIANYESELNKLEQELQGLSTSRQDAERKINSSRKRIVEKCFDLRNKFRGFVKERLQYGGSKENHYNHVASKLNGALMSVTFDAIESEYQKLYEKDLVKIDKIVDDVLWRSIIDAEDRLNSILGKVIVGHDSVDVSGLIQKLNMSSWVAVGRAFLDKSDGVCPFCQQPLVDRDGLINKLNEFFDESYNKSLQELEESSREYMEKIGNLKNRLKRLSDTGAADVYKSLSEGEKTFISFLYFYQLCIGTDDMTQSAKKKVIVIDDPISSLDSQTLFIVSSIVLKMIMHSDSNKNQFKDKNINQIFILTHNLYFYKEISFERRPSCRDVMHYNLRKVAGHTIIDSSSKQLATDDYSLMWESLKVVKGQTGVDETRNMMVCNTMRRIIDTFVGFIGLSKGSGNPTWASISSLTSTDPRYIVASSFIAQINDDSHGVHVFDNAYYGNIIRQDTSVLFEAFKLVFDEIGTDHYAMMMC